MSRGCKVGLGIHNRLVKKPKTPKPRHKVTLNQGNTTHKTHKTPQIMTQNIKTNNCDSFGSLKLINVDDRKRNKYKNVKMTQQKTTSGNN